MRAMVTLANGNIIRETDKAILFDLDGEKWMPKSQIELDIDREQYNATGTLTMPVWLAKQKGLWGYDCYGRRICQLID
jgi:hypothetical protein